MATALPQLRTVKSGESKSGYPSPPQTGTPKSRAGTSLTGKSAKLKNASRKEVEIIQRRERLRGELPILNKAQTAEYVFQLLSPCSRNSFKIYF